MLDIIKVSEVTNVSLCGAIESDDILDFLDLDSGFTCWVFSMDAVISRMHGRIGA